MSKEQTGGPAFPQFVVSNGGAYVEGGMTLRDYFAAKASEEDIAEFLPQSMGELKLHPYRTRQWARYRHADQMLKAREA